MVKLQCPDATKVPVTRRPYGWRSGLMGVIIFLLSCQPLFWQLHAGVISPSGPEYFTLLDLPAQPKQLLLPQHPRVLQYTFETNKASRSTSDSSLPKEFHHAGKSYEVAHSSGDSEDSKTCRVMHDWQTRIYPSCNNVHEINMRPETGSVKFINCGGDRCAFRIVGSSGEGSVLKISKYRKDFYSSRYDAARKDGMSMERLQASPYVLDIYGYCGLSQVIEPGDAGGNLHDLIKTTRLKRTDSLEPIDKLKILYQLASGVADMHTFERDGLVSLVHNDICCHQFILSHGIYKLNDFHLAQFQRQNRNSNTVCSSRNNYSNYYKLIRSPEEIAYKLKITNQGDIMLEKSDVYTLGNVMYYVFTFQWLFEELSTDDAVRIVTEGSRSPFPKGLLENPDRAIRAMRKAIEMCWTHDPEKRSTADDVRNFLGRELKAVLGVAELGVVRVDSIEALPTDYSYNDKDFHTMFDD